jgi:tripeptidyl-peptidase-1
MFSATLLLSLVAAAIATPSRRMVVHESRTNVPAGWKQVAPADASRQINMRIALTQTNMPGLIDALYAVSTPSSKSYGQHLAKEEVRGSVQGSCT